MRLMSAYSLSMKNEYVAEPPVSNRGSSDLQTTVPSLGRRGIPDCYITMRIRGTDVQPGQCRFSSTSVFLWSFLVTLEASS